LNKFLKKSIITTAPSVYAMNLTATFENYRKILHFIKTWLTCPIFALQHRSSDSFTPLSINN
jgi:hypothetical protein